MCQPSSVALLPLNCLQGRLATEAERLWSRQRGRTDPSREAVGMWLALANWRAKFQQSADSTQRYLHMSRQRCHCLYSFSGRSQGPFSGLGPIWNAHAVQLSQSASWWPPLSCWKGATLGGPYLGWAAGGTALGLSGAGQFQRCRAMPRYSLCVLCLEVPSDARVLVFPGSKARELGSFCSFCCHQWDVHPTDRSPVGPSAPVSVHKLLLSWDISCGQRAEPAARGAGSLLQGLWGSHKAFSWADRGTQQSCLKWLNRTLLPRELCGSPQSGKATLSSHHGLIHHSLSVWLVV